MGTEKQMTGMASEYYVLSLLNRVGAEAYLTLGNTKKSDILVKKGYEAITIDVKGCKSSSFPIGTEYESKKDKNHFYVFLYYKNFEDIHEIPEIYIVPSLSMDFVRNYKGSSNVFLNDLKEKGYSDDFSIFAEKSE